MPKNKKNNSDLKLKIYSKPMKILLRRNVIDEQPINSFDKVKAWLNNQNKFENLELLSEVVSQQKYLEQNDKLSSEVINQLEDTYLAIISNLNEKNENLLI